MTKASYFPSKDATVFVSGTTTESTCCCVSMPGGPSFSVIASMRGPPSMRSGAQASSMPRVTASVEFGLMTRMVALMLPLSSLHLPLDRRSDYSGSGRRTVHEFETRPGRARRARARGTRIGAVRGARAEVGLHAAQLPPRQPAERLDPRRGHDLDRHALHGRVQQPGALRPGEEAEQRCDYRARPRRKLVVGRYAHQAHLQAAPGGEVARRQALHGEGRAVHLEPAHRQGPRRVPQEPAPGVV